MSIDTTFSVKDRVLTISIAGKFNFDKLQEFRKSYSEQATAPSQIVINMRQTTSIDSSALGMLLNLKRTLKQEDKAIDIVSCNDSIKKVFQVSLFEKKFNIS